MLDVLDALPARNTVVLTGDLHLGVLSCVLRKGTSRRPEGLWQRRGSTTYSVTPWSWQVDFRVVDQVDSPGAALSTHASFEVERRLRVSRR